MNRKQQEIALAEYLGAKWLDIPPLPYSDTYTDEENKMFDRLHPKRLLAFGKWDFGSARCAPLPFPDPAGDATSIPKYGEDLNAMRDALLTLDDEQAIRYRCVLTQMAVDRNFDPMVATAGQQAEAFLRTLNLYTE